jgi:hypothetical protein
MKIAPLVERALEGYVYEVVHVTIRTNSTIDRSDDG